PVALRGGVEPPRPALRELRRGERVRRAVLRARSGTHVPGGPHARLGPMSVPASSRATSRDASGGRAGTVRLPRAAAVALALAVLLAGAATPLRAQAPAPDAGEGWRIGLTLGGIATGGLTVEYFRDAWSLDVTFGTFSFRDLGVSPVLKRYLGSRAARAYVGLGFWTILAAPA